MSNFVPEKVFLRRVLLHYFNMKKTAAESHRILVEVYGGHDLAERTFQKWLARFKSGAFGLEDEERPGHPKKFEYIQKQGNWVPHELKLRDVERRFCMSEMLLERHKKKSFFIGLLLVMKNGSLRQPQG